MVGYEHLRLVAVVVDGVVHVVVDIDRLNAVLREGAGEVGLDGELLWRFERGIRQLIEGKYLAR